MNRQSTLIRTLSALAIGVAAVSSSVAHADTFENDLFYRPSTTSQVSRAEVLADLQIYRESGLADAEHEAFEIGGSVDLRPAQARYEALRNGERFKMLVSQISQRTGEPSRQVRGA